MNFSHLNQLVATTKQHFWNTTVGTMNPAECQQSLSAFLRAVRNRLWLQAVAEWFFRGLVVTALGLVSTGLIAVFWLPLPLQPYLTIAVLPPCMALLAGLLGGRPSLETCARLADRWFAGKSLLTSAWDLLNHPQTAHPVSARWILNQAQQAVILWHDRLTTRRFLRLPGHATVSLVLSLVGLFLLSSQSMLSSTSTAWTPPDPVLQPLVSHPLSPTRLREIAAATAGPVNRRTGPGQAGTPEPVARRADRAADMATLDSESTSLAMPAKHPVSAEADQRATAGAVAADSSSTAGGTAGPADSTAGDQRPGSGSDTQRTAAHPAPAAALTVQYMDIVRRQTGGQQTAAAAAGELEGFSAMPQGSATAAVPPAEQPVMPYAAAFNPALRRYIAHYFLELGNEHQPPGNRPADPAR
jgi:hypothetical protein